MPRGIVVFFVSILCACSSATPNEDVAPEDSDFSVLVRTAEVGPMRTNPSPRDSDPGFETVVREVFQGGPIESSEPKPIQPGSRVRFVQDAERETSVEIEWVDGASVEFISYEVSVMLDGKNLAATDGVARRRIGDCTPGSGSRTVIFAPEERADARAGLAIEVTFCRS